MDASCVIAREGKALPKARAMLGLPRFPSLSGNGMTMDPRTSQGPEHELAVSRDRSFRAGGATHGVSSVDASVTRQVRPIVTSGRRYKAPANFVRAPAWPVEWIRGCTTWLGQLVITPLTRPVLSRPSTLSTREFCKAFTSWLAESVAIFA